MDTKTAALDASVVKIARRMVARLTPHFGRQAAEQSTFDDLLSLYGGTAALAFARAEWGWK